MMIIYACSMNRRLERIEQELSKVLPDTVESWWIDWIADEEVKGATLKTYELFCEPARDLIRRGGKRWRPYLMVLVAEMLGGEESAEIAYQLASVVELPHTGSLIIDDIEDSSQWRRGGPAVHTIYGMDISINAGNLLYYLPTKAIDAVGLDDARRLRIYQIYAKYLRRVHFGQGLDIAWHRDMRLIPSPEEYEQMCRYKTGCLAGMSAEIGASAATDDPETVSRAGDLAEKIGVGFQIKDDVINLKTGNPGKQRGDDIVENKKSLPIILYLTAYPERIDSVLSVFELARKRGLEGAAAEVEGLIEDMRVSGVIAAAERRAEELLREAIEEIRELFDPSDVRDELVSMLKGFIAS